MYKTVFIALVLVACCVTIGCPSSKVDNATNKPTNSGVRASLKPRQLVTTYSCTQAEAVIIDQQKMAQLSADDLNEVTAVWETCAAALHNQLNPKNPRVVVVMPAADVPGKVQVTTVDQNNLDDVKQTCHKVTSWYFRSTEAATTVAPVADAVVVGVDVLTDSGHTDCDSFIHGAQTKNPLIVLAPSIIAGSGVTTHILSEIGAGTPAGKIQPMVDQLGKNLAKVGTGLATTSSAISQNPIIFAILPLPRVVTIPIVGGPLPVLPTPPIPVIQPIVQCATTPWTCMGSGGNPGNSRTNPLAPVPAGLPPRPR